MDGTRATNERRINVSNSLLAQADCAPAAIKNVALLVWLVRQINKTSELGLRFLLPDFYGHKIKVMFSD